MKTSELINLFGIILLISSNLCVNAFPAVEDEVTTEPEIKLEEVLENKDENVTSTPASLPALSNNDTSTPITELETAGSEQHEQRLAMEKSDNAVAASNIDPTIYGGGGLIPPDAFQQYINHYGAPYPYAAAPYPAPVYPGFVPPPPPIYPSPYVIETGYEGFLLPTTTTSTTTAASDTSSTTAATTVTNPFMLISNFFSNLLMTPIFRILLTIISTVGMIFFGEAIMDFICDNTPICNMSNKAVTYLRRQEAAEHMGRMIVDGMTSERVRRTAEFVRNAIDKYQKLQKLMGEKNNSDSATSKRRK